MEVLECATAQQLRRNCENFLKDEQGRRLPSRPPVLLQEPLRGGTLPQLVGNLALPVQTERELSRYVLCHLLNSFLQVDQHKRAVHIISQPALWRNDAKNVFCADEGGDVPVGSAQMSNVTSTDLLFSEPCRQRGSTWQRPQQGRMGARIRRRWVRRRGGGKTGWTSPT